MLHREGARVSFEVALLVSLAVHLALFTGIQIVWLFRLRPEIDYRPYFWGRLLFAFVFWQGCVEVFDGCPFTHVENAIARAAYDRPFYPDYSKRDSLLYQAFMGEQP
ncbi:MAG: hypothetical protein KC656_06450 [Myxococcales bacterium]|nr:hypothetical protein [Myxococcales bacterium]